MTKFKESEDKKGKFPLTESKDKALLEASLLVSETEEIGDFLEATMTSPEDDDTPDTNTTATSKLSNTTLRLDKVFHNKKLKDPKGTLDLSNILDEDGNSENNSYINKLRRSIYKFNFNEDEFAKRLADNWNKYQNKIKAKPQKRSWSENQYKQAFTNAYTTYNGLEIEETDSHGTILLKRTNKDGSIKAESTISVQRTTIKEESTAKETHKLIFKCSPQTNDIDVLIELALQAKKKLKDPDSYTFFIRPNDNTAALKELFLKAHIYGLKPELQNYPIGNESGKEPWEDHKFEELKKLLLEHVKSNPFDLDTPPHAPEIYHTDAEKATPAITIHHRLPPSTPPGGSSDAEKATPTITIHLPPSTPRGGSSP